MIGAKRGTEDADACAEHKEFASTKDQFAKKSQESKFKRESVWKLGFEILFVKLQIGFFEFPALRAVVVCIRPEAT